MRTVPYPFALVVLMALAACPPADNPSRRAISPPVQRGPTATAAVLPAHTRALDAIFLGDFGTGGPGQRAVAAMLHEHVDRPLATLLLTTGDNFYPKGVNGVDDEKFKRVIADVYGPLQLPIYPSLGNHDHLGDVQAQVDYSGVNPQWHLPHRYHAFVNTVTDGLKIRFVVVDTDPLRRGDAEQVAWLKRTLVPSDVAYTIVYGHHPIYSAGPHGKDTALGEILTPLLDPAVVDAYVAGHDHILEVVGERHGVLHLVAGGGAGTDRPYPLTHAPGVFGFTGGGVVHLRATPEALHFALVDDQGKTRFVYRRPRRVTAALPGAPAVRESIAPAPGQ